MKKLKNIVISLAWDLELAHEFAKGFFEYARTKSDWNCRFPSLNVTQGGMDGWTGLDGLVMAGDIRPYCTALLKRGLSAVAVHWIPDAPELCQADTDPLTTGAFAAHHLMRGGYRRLAAVCRLDDPQHRARAEAFADTCRRRAVSCELFFCNKADSTEVPPRILEWIRSGDLPVAFFCTEDGCARWILTSVMEAGLHIPDDVAVLGCEDDLKTCEGGFPSISSVHLPYRQAGTEAARLLDAQLSGKKIRQRQIFLDPESITVRMSTSIFATGDAQLRRAVEFIRRHACEGATARQAARHAGLTVGTLQRRFRSEIGHGPSTELQRIRLDKAKELLRRTDLSLDEIAEAAGYAGGHYLSKIFKQKTGQTVRQYRKIHRSSQS